MVLGLWLLLMVIVAWWAYRAGRRAAGWAAVVGWVSLPGYNAWVLQRCPGDCGIRVDLVLVLPILLVVSGLALWGALRHWFRPRKS